MLKLSLENSQKLHYSMNYDQALKKPNLFHKSLNINQLKQNIFAADQQKAYLHFLTYVFDSYEEYSRLLPELVSVSKAVCSAPIYTKQQAYKCIDCEVDTNSIFCRQCFEYGYRHGKHKGHKFVLGFSQTNGGFCDCGDGSHYKSEGFCFHHNGVINYGKELDKNLLIRLRQALMVVFELFFQLTQAKMNICNLRQLPKELNPNRVVPQMKKFMFILYMLITDFCSNKFSLQHEIFKILVEPLNQQRFHDCNEKDQYKFWVSTQKHICHKSAFDLFYRYCLFFDKQIVESISLIQINLLAHKETRLQLCKVFFDNYEFLFFLLKKFSTNIMFVSRFLTDTQQFSSAQQMQYILKHQNLQKITSLLHNIIKQINFKYYAEIWDTFIFNLVCLKFIAIRARKNKVITQHQQLELFSILFDFSDTMNSKYGFSFQHHAVKLLFNYFILTFGFQIAKQLKLQAGGNLKVYQKFILNYLSREKKQEDKQLLSGQNIIADWVQLNDLLVGSILLKIYLKLGSDSVKRILSLCIQNNRLSQYTERIVNSLINAYKISKSTQVGFPNQLPLSQLYKVEYLSSNKFIYDTAIATLQLIALIAPNQLAKQLLKFQLENSLHLLSEILIEQSCFINLSSELDHNQNQLAKNALDLLLISILNLKKNIRISDLSSNFNDYMLNKPLNQVLQRVANFNQLKQTYSVKSEFEDIRQSILVKRTKTFFSELFDRQSSIKNMLKKDNLFQKQMELEKPTICLLITEQMAKSQLFLILVEKLSDYLWETSFSSQNYELIKLMFAICIRNPGNLEIQNILQKKISQKPVTQSQKILHKMLQNLTLSQLRLSTRMSTSIKPVKVNKAKQRFQKLKQQQQLFLENNKNLLNEVREQKVQEQQKQICLICHQPSSHQNPTSSIILLKNFIFDEGKTCQMYISCDHFFHKDCLKLSNAVFCPVCKSFFNAVFSHPQFESITFLNPKSDNRINISSTTPFDIHYNSQNQILAIFDVIVYKTYFSILSQFQNFKKESKTLKLFCAWLLSVSGKINTYTNGALLKHYEQKITPQTKSKFCIDTIIELYTVAVFKGSLDTKKQFEQISSITYTKYLAYNFLCFTGGSINEGNFQTEFKQHQEAIKHQMNEFVKALMYCYYILFDDKRNAIFDNLKQQFGSTQIILKQYPEFFKLNQEVFAKQIFQGSKNQIFKSVDYQSLVVTPKTIEVPETLLDFHLKYNDLKCDDCKDIVRAEKDHYLICLFCGFKCCTAETPNHKQAPKFALFYRHFFNSHNQQCLAFNFTTLEIYYISAFACFTYDFLYKPKFGQLDITTNTDWSNYKLNHLKWNIILEQLRKRTILPFVFQSQLPAKQLLQV